MKNSFATLPLLLLALVLCGACKEKTEHKDIIVPAPTHEVSKETEKVSTTDTDMKSEIEWLGNTYTIFISRKADRSLPKVVDENGTEYFDNVITLRILRKDNSEFINKTFHKSDFSSYLHGTNYGKSGVLLGIVFDRIVNNKLTFATSVGSPDLTSDEYMPLIMSIDRMGNISITPDTSMDTNPDNSAGSQGGITGDEEA